MSSELNIIVTVKQVPDTKEIKIDPKTSSLKRDGVPSVINPDDKMAVEAALLLSRKHGGTVTAVTMGPAQAEDVLLEALAMGVDRAVLLTDRAFAESDTLITAFILSRAVMKLGGFDLVVCGQKSIDGETGQVGPQLAGFLDVPQVTCAGEIVCDDGRVTVKRILDDCDQMVRTRLPALITVGSLVDKPRYPSLNNVVKACSSDVITVWCAEDLNIPGTMTGLSASPTYVSRVFVPEKKGTCEIISGDDKQMAVQLVAKLKHLQCFMKP